MNNLISKLFLLIFLLISMHFAKAQNEMLYSNSIVGDEFLNPGFNAINGYPTIGVMEYKQWNNSVEGSPKSKAVNSFLPINKVGLGLGINIVGEEIGLRVNNLISASLSQKVRLSTRSILAFGVGFGIQRNEFNEQDIIAQTGTSDLQSMNYDETFKQLSIGMVYRQTWFYTGISSNILLKKSLKNNLLPGFDFTSGAILKLRNFNLLPRFGFSSYQIKESVTTSEGTDYAESSSQVFKLSCGLVYDNKVQIGTSHWFNHSQSFSLDVIIQKKLKIGYVYEIGIGDGINSYNSNGVRLSVDFSRKKQNRRYMFNPLGFTIL